MIRDEEKYLKARDFRKRGFTYTEIATIVGVSRGTLSSWFSKQIFSKKVRKDNEIKARRDNVKRISLLNKARTKERDRLYKATVKQAEVEYRHYKNSPLFMAGLMLYVSEGDSTSSHLLRLSSSRSDIHRIFIKFAIDFLGVEKNQIKFWLLLYPDLSEKACVEVWSKSLKLKPEQFYKNQVIEGKSHKRTLQYGVGNTIIGSTVLKYKLNKWIELATKELTSSKIGR